MNIDEIGSYQVRVRDCPECSDIEGQIVYIRDVTRDGIVFSMTEDCRPLDQQYKLSSASNDNGWHNITDLVMDANLAIMPKYNSCNFASEVAMEYRNFLDPEVLTKAQLTDEQAVGKLCLLGTISQRKVSLSKQVYYVVAKDKDGYVLGYSGFCKPVTEWEEPCITQRVLKLSGTGKSFFYAMAVVGACNSAFGEDMESASAYAMAIMDTAIPGHSLKDVSSKAFPDTLSKMSLS